MSEQSSSNTEQCPNCGEVEKYNPHQGEYATVVYCCDSCGEQIKKSTRIEDKEWFGSLHKMEEREDYE